MAGNKPKPPADISGEALIEWNRVCGELKKAGTLTKEDRAIITLYVRTWAANHAAASHVAQHGAVIKWPNGVPGPSPYYKVMSETGKALRGLLADLNLTPASRKPTANEDDAGELDI